MVPAHTSIEFEFTGILVVQVQTDHLVGCKALTGTAETATATTTGEAHIIGIVGIGHQEYLHIVFHHTSEDTACIAVLGTCGEVGIGHDTLVHACLDAEVEHRLFLTVFNTGDTGKVALLVVGLDAVDDVRGQVLHGGLRVASHELFTVNKDLLHLLAIDLDGSVVADLCTWQTAHQFFGHRSFRCTEGIGIIDKGIGLERHLLGTGRHRGTLQHDGIGFQFDRAGMIVFVLQRDLLRVGLETHIGHLQGIRTLRGLDGESSFCVSDGIGNDLLTTQQGGGSLNDGFLRVLFYYCSSYCSLCKCYDCHHQGNNQQTYFLH